MCYRNGTGRRCECCGKKAKEIKFVTYGADELNNKPVSDRDRLCPETEEAFGSGWTIPEPALMIAVTPGEAMQIITEFEAEEYLPDFEYEYDIYEVPEVGLMMSYQKEGVFQVGDRYYLETSFLIYVFCKTFLRKLQTFFAIIAFAICDFCRSHSKGFA